MELLPRVEARWRNGWATTWSHTALMHSNGNLQETSMETKRYVRLVCTFFNRTRTVYTSYVKYIFDKIAIWRHMKSMLQIRFPLFISSLLPLLSISYWLMKINGTQRWTNWIDGTWWWRDLNPWPPDLILDTWWIRPQDHSALPVSVVSK